MKQHYKQIFLALLLCGTSVATKATEEDLINENFNSLSVSDAATISGWTFTYCYGAYNGDMSDLANKALNIQGTATTSNFTKDANVILKFSYRNSNGSKNSTFYVTLNNAGTFADGTNKIELSPKENSTTFSKTTRKIYGATSETTITFKLKTSDAYFIIDDLTVTAVNETFSENDVTTDLETKTADVTLNRTLTGGIWNTLCLPFDVDMNLLEMALGEDKDIQVRTFSAADGNILTFANANSSTIAAGTPFLIKTSATVENPTFPLVDIVAGEPGTVTFGEVSMKGVYHKTDINPNDMFLNSDGQLKKPTAGNTTLKGLRAYFTATGDVRPILRFSTDGVTDINEPISLETDADEWYTLNGVRLSTAPTQKGLYIYNGKKVTVK